MNHMERFHQYAIQQQLSSTAILLWQQLYFSMHRKGTASGAAMNTSYLLASLRDQPQGVVQCTPEFGGCRSAAGGYGASDVVLHVANQWSDFGV